MWKREKKNLESTLKEKEELLNKLNAQTTELWEVHVELQYLQLLINLISTLILFYSTYAANCKLTAMVHQTRPLPKHLH